MRAKVLQSCDQGLIVACGGLRFSKREYTAVPAHEEESARLNPFLEIEPDAAPEPENVSTETVEPDAAPVAKRSKK